MKTIDENALISLGFERTDVSPEESGCDNPFHYYSMDVSGLCLITNANDENANKEKTGGFSVEILECEGVEITDAADLNELIDLLKRNKKEKQ